MNHFINKLSKITIGGFGGILIYSFTVSFFTGYSDFIDEKIRILYSVTLAFTIIVILFTVYKSRERIVKHSFSLYRISDFSIFFIALLIRLIWVSFSGIDITEDYLYYHNNAIKILDGNPIISVDRPPGASIFFAIHYYLFGISPIYPRIVLAILSSIQVILILNIARLYVNSKIKPIVGALILAFYPEHILYCNLLGSDVLFTTLLLFAICLIILGFKKYPDYQTQLLSFSGFIMGLSHWVRTVMPMYFMAVFLFLLIIPRKLFPGKIRKISVLVLSTIIPIIPIIMFNYNTLGTYSIHSSQNKGFSIAIGTLPESHGRAHLWAKSDDYNLFENYYNNIISADKNDNQKVLLNEALTSWGLNRIIMNPGRYIKFIFLDKISNSWGIISLAQSLDTTILSSILPFVWFISDLYHRIIILVVGVLMLNLIFQKVPYFDERHIILFSAIIFTISAFILECSPRYHHPFLPFLCLFIGSTDFDSLFKRKIG